MYVFMSLCVCVVVVGVTSGDWIGDTGAQALAEALKVNRTLVAVSLFGAFCVLRKRPQQGDWRADGVLRVGSRISDDGVHALIEALQLNPSVCTVER